MKSRSKQTHRKNDKVCCRYHDATGVVLGPSKNHEKHDLWDIQFPKGTPNTGRHGRVKQYAGHDLTLVRDNGVSMYSDEVTK